MRRVLLIDDDPIQHRLTEGYFAGFRLEQFELDFADTFEAGLAKLLQGGYAACLLDYQLGSQDGLALIREAVKQGCTTPIIFLTAETGASIDIQAMEAGALDYLIKGEFSAASLERALRYALKLGDTLEELKRLATRDSLTGLLNRREIDRVLQDEAERARRFERPLGLVMLDIDHFKAINDTHGHAIGDKVLNEVAARLAFSVRTVDRVGRFGGEEFVVMIPEADALAALQVAENLVDAIKRDPVRLESGLELTVTISAGAAAEEGHGASVQRLLDRADQALYQAKRAGRNRAQLFRST